MTVIPSASTRDATGAVTGELEDELTGAFATEHEASKSMAKDIKTRLEFKILIAAIA